MVFTSWINKLFFCGLKGKIIFTQVQFWSNHLITSQADSPSCVCYDSGMGEPHLHSMTQVALPHPQAWTHGPIL